MSRFDSISCFHGQTPKVSSFGHGMCQNSAMVASGLRARNMPGSSAKW